jgi:hypothetical protein
VRGVISSRQSKTTCRTFREKVVVRQFPRANHQIFAGDDLAVDLTNPQNKLEIKIEPEEKRLHKWAKVHDVLEIWQGSQNQQSTQKYSCTQIKPMTATEYISDTEEIAKAS